MKPSSRKNIVDSIFKEIYLLILNKTEFKTLYQDGKTLEERAKYFLKKGVKNIIITSEKEGYIFLNEKTQKKFKEINFPSIDTTGSSDIFIATLTSYLIKNFSIEKSIEIASYAAAFSTLYQGASNGLIDKVSLENYILKINPQFFD